MKTVIFDFDQTIADTSSLEPYRKSRDWSFVRNNIHKIKPYQEICSILEAISKSGYKVGVVSTSPKFYCEKGLSFLGVRVDCIIGYHDVRNRKPAPDSILLALRTMGANPAETIGFGDHVNDIVAYNAAKIKSVACMWGCADRAGVSNAQPTYTIHAPQEILTLLNVSLESILPF